MKSAQPDTDNRSQLIWPYILFGLIFLSLFILQLFSGIYDPGDGVQHHLIARYAGKHPQLFLDHWGKPVFTLLSFPFASTAGYNGSVAFNLLCLCGSGFLVWKAADHLKLPYPIAGAAFTVFAPIALPAGLSALTEPLFAFTLVSGVYLALKGRSGMAALIISFLPFVRTEGFFLAPLFGIVFLMRKDFLSFFLLGTGTLIYSFTGFFYYGDLLWLIHQNPYQGDPAYGSGSFFHFLTSNEFIWGWGLTAFLLMGFVVYLFPKKLGVNISAAEKILVPGIFLLFMLLHSFLWWKGLFGSLGLTRVFAGTIPLAALIALRGFHLVFYFVQHPALRRSVLVVLVGMQIFLTFRQHALPLDKTAHETTADETIAWMKENKLHSRRIIATHPIIALVADKDPFDSLQWKNLGCVCPEKWKKGDLILWESYFAPGQSGITLESLQNDPRLEQQKIFGALPDNKGSAAFTIAAFVVK
ncbi:MAG TPA: hypothetical protein VI731_11055 [Bacteroidia bacterium]|nr:hypothetical protein [Bacteroidia bacterium]